MTRLRKAKFLKIYDIQKILKYFCLGMKRPHYIQYQSNPNGYLMALLRNPPNSKELKRLELSTVAVINEGIEIGIIFDNLLKDIEGGCNNGECNDKEECNGEHDGKHDKECNDGANESDTVPGSKNRLPLNLAQEDLEMIHLRQEDLEMIPKHNIVDIFSYSAYVSDQKKFNIQSDQEKSNIPSDLLDDTTNQKDNTTNQKDTLSDIPSDFNISFFQGFVRPIKNSNYFLISIDCEMLMTIDGPKVGRVTLLDHMGITVYDEYVRPESKVLDYLEKYSGLNEVNTGEGKSFQEIQKDLLEVIGTNTYVLGHGLENDFTVLELYVDKVIDTSYLFLSSEGYKMKLKQLSKCYLNREIQSGTHSSREDALCCLLLLSYKVIRNRRLLDEWVPEIFLGEFIKGNEGEITEGEITREGEADMKRNRTDDSGNSRTDDDSNSRTDDDSNSRTESSNSNSRSESNSIRKIRFTKLNDSSSIKRNPDRFLMCFYSKEGRNYAAFKETDIRRGKS